VPGVLRSCANTQDSRQLSTARGCENGQERRSSEQTRAVDNCRGFTQGPLSPTLSAEEPNKLLREKVDLLVRKLFGVKSEKIDDAQLMLMLQGESPPPKPDASASDATGLEAELDKGNQTLKAKPARRERKLRIPAHLPVSEEIIIDPDEVTARPENYRQIGEEITEQLDCAPPKFSRRLIIRRKYVKRDEPHQAPLIAKLDTLADRSTAAPGLLAQIVVAKYCDHLPLYRQEQIFKLRHDIEIPRQTMARWISMVAEWFKPIYGRIKERVLESGYIETDETMLEYLQPGNGETKQCYFWTLKQPGGDSVFIWETSRAAACLERILPDDFQGIIGCDGYGVYQHIATGSEGRIRLAACWAHVRRKFDEARTAYPQAAATMLLLIQKLYLIEKHARAPHISAKLRQVMRAQQSRMIIARIEELLKKLRTSDRFLPKSLMGQAIDYTLTLWPHLQVYLENGRVEIDNNLVENAIRPTAIGKKNWLFIGEAGAGERSAILFTIIEACRSRRIAPWTYIRDVLTRLPSMTNQQLDEVTPWAWAAAPCVRQRQTARPIPGQSQAAA
jgi:transposase